MIFSWNSFNEKVKIKKLAKKISKGGTFKNINIDLSESGRDLKSIMKGIAKKLNLDGKLKAYKAGSFGVTFLWGNRTIKVTTSDIEADMIAHVIDYQKHNKTKHIISYYDIFKLNIGSKSKKDYFVIVMDKISPLDSKENADVYTLYNDYIDGKYDYVKDFGEIDDITAEIVEEIEDQFTDEERKKLCLSLAFQTGDLCKEWVKMGLTNNDIHSGNLGLDSNGVLKSFDPLGSATKKNIKVLNV